MEGIVVRGAAVNDKLAKVTIRGVPDEPGVAAGIFHQIAAASVVVDDIIQNISLEGQTDLSFTVEETDTDAVRDVGARLVSELGAKGLEIDDSVAKVSVVGLTQVGFAMLYDVGVWDYSFDALSLLGIVLVVAPAGWLLYVERQLLAKE